MILSSSVYLGEERKQPKQERRSAELSITAKWLSEVIPQNPKTEINIQQVKEYIEKLRIQTTKGDIVGTIRQDLLEIQRNMGLDEKIINKLKITLNDALNEKGLAEIAW